MKKVKSKNKNSPSPLQGEKEVQKNSTEFNEQTPFKRPHGDTGEKDRQTPREHPHEFTTPVVTKEMVAGKKK
jgi:hypothetical protein